MSKNWRTKPYNTGTLLGSISSEDNYGILEEQIKMLEEINDLVEEAGQWVQDTAPHDFEFLRSIADRLYRRSMLATLSSNDGMKYQLYRAVGTGVQELSVRDRLTAGQSLRLVECYLRATHADVPGIWEIRCGAYSSALGVLQKLIRIHELDLERQKALDAGHHTPK